MKLITWNVNGIRSVLKGGFDDFLKKYEPDVLCVQETKPPKTSFALDFPKYQEFWNNGVQCGYAGTAVLTKVKPVKVANGIGIAKHDQEGRVITVEFDKFFLVNVYVPNSKRELTRLDYRTKEWDVDFLKYLKNLEKKKPVIFCGDLNVAHKEIDLTNPKANVKNHGFTPEERAGFDSVIKAGFVDIFREHVKEGGHYTWWSRFNNCRARNIGWRIDYFVVSPSLKPRVKEVNILTEVLGSDHCPVELVLKD
jgi:exodeoxyribonuclease-3